MNLVFNELSATYFPMDHQQSIAGLEQFVKTYSAFQRLYPNASRQLLTTVDLNHLQIADNYFVSQWRNSNNVDRDIKNVFRGICNRQSIVIEIDDEIEVTCELGAGQGLQMAHINDYLAISLANNDFWKSFLVAAKCYTLENDTEDNITIHNLSIDSHLLEYKDLIDSKASKNYRQYRTASMILNDLESLFPSLRFHDNALSQLSDDVEPQHLHALLDKLMVLEQYFSRWDGIRFDPNAFGIKVSPQSKATLERYKDDHTFTFDGGTIVVSYHARYTGNIPVLSRIMRKLRNEAAGLPVS